MQMKHILAPAAALLLLSVLAAPTEAQRGRSGHGGHGGSGYHGKSHGGGGGHHRGYSGHGGLHYGRGYGSYGYSHRGNGYRGGYGHRGYSGHGGYRSYGYKGHHGYRGHYGYGTHYSYGYKGYGYPGAYGHRSTYRSHGYRPYGAYVYYGGPGHYGAGYSGYPVSIYYQASPRYVVYGGGYEDTRPSYERYAPYVAIPEGGVTESGEPYRESTEPAGGPADAREQPARLRLAIEPGDAAVYLDGAFLGLASELPEELLVEPGSHVLAAARPGYAGSVLDLELEAGEELDVEARLEAEAP